MATAAGVDVEERPSARDGARVSTIWVILVLIVGAFGLAHNASRAWDRWTNYAGYGDLGIGDDACGPDGFCRIDAVTPGGPMAVLGVQKGDAVRYDRGIDRQGTAGRVLRPGEKVGFTLRRSAALSHHVATAEPLRVPPAGARPLVIFATWAITSLIGLFVMLRSRGRATNVLLGAALIAVGGGGQWPGLTESDPALYPAVVCVENLELLAPVLFLAFALAARRETSGKAAGGWRAFLVAYAAVLSVIVVGVDIFFLTPRALFDARAFVLTETAVTDLGYLLAILVLGVAWRESRGRDRMRFAFMLVAIGLLAGSDQVVAFAIILTGNDWSLTNPLVVAEVVGATAGAAVFAYAVLRHHILDLGFAVNRTLVFGVVSAILLAAFGLIEWAVEHFIPIKGREENALIDAAIAVGVFLTFHRVRDVVEHVIERLFFRRWQRAEVDLRRFVREAAFATRAETLTRGFAAALTNYAEGAQAAVYLLDDAGRYRLAGGAVARVGEALDPDDPAVMAIRAEPKPLMPDRLGSVLEIALAAPMVNRNEVIGLAVLGPKSSGVYRPDEVELVAWGTHQVGLDLHALKMEGLEASEADLRQEVSVLSAKLDVALSAIGQRS
jgi:hypothetical protein